MKQVKYIVHDYAGEKDNHRTFTVIGHMADIVLAEDPKKMHITILSIDYICPYYEETIVEDEETVCIACAIGLGEQADKAHHLNNCKW